jgi:hypothetical protein
VGPARRIAAAALLLAALTVAPLAEGRSSEPESSATPGDVGVEEARAVLRLAERIRAGGDGGHLTPVLLRLVEAYPSLGPGERRRAERILARPTDGPRDQLGHGYESAEAPRSPACTPNICVHWVETGVQAPSPRDDDGSFDGDGVPDYVEAVARAAERSHAVLNGKLRWRPARSDGRRGGRAGKTDVYVTQLGTGLFGYAAPDPGQRRGNRFRRSLHGYLVVDDDYHPGEFPGTTPPKAMKVTIAHEYNHILQFAYDAFQDRWMTEASATWAEERVYDWINDYLRFVRRWARTTEVPLTGGAARVYGNAVWNLWLQRHYGHRLIRAAWGRARRTRPGGFSVAVYDAAIRAAGRSSLRHDFARFARDTAEWRTGHVFAEGASYPRIERRGRLPLRGRGLRPQMDHLTFRLLRVRPVRARAVRVTAYAPRGLASGLALVGRTGSERRGRAVSRLVFRRRGGRMSVRLRRPGRFRRLTAVLVNAQAGQRGLNRHTGDWLYRGNDARFAIFARRVR